MKFLKSLFLVLALALPAHAQTIGPVVQPPTAAAPTANVTSVANLTALANVDPAIYQSVILTDTLRAGTFNWRVFNCTAAAALDPLFAIYRQHATIPLTTGCFVRNYSGGISLNWFGADPTDGAADNAAIQAAFTFFDQGWTTGLLPAANSNYIEAQAGVYFIDPTSPINIYDFLDFRGQGIGSSIFKAVNTSAGSFFRRPYNGTSSGNPRVTFVEISGVRGVVTGQNQIIFELRHAGRTKVFNVMGTTQTRVDDYNNALQRYWPGSTLFSIGVGDSTPNGYINGSDVMELTDFTANFLDYGVRGSGSANQKQPEYLIISDAEISDVHQPIVLNASAGMMGNITRMIVQRWGNESINAVTALPGADNYGVDVVTNKYYFNTYYCEGNSAFACIILRAGNDNVLDASTMNRYGTTTTIYSNGATGTVIR